MAKKQTEQETLAERLKRMAQTDIRTVDKNTLVERSTVKLDPAMSREERILSFIEQIKNPYCYLDDGVVVKVSFMDTDPGGASGRICTESVKRIFLSQYPLEKCVELW